MDSFDFGFVLPKTEAGEAAGDRANAWLGHPEERRAGAKSTPSGSAATESDKDPAGLRRLPRPNGTLTMATEGTYAPMNYYRGNESVGFEIDLAARFCEANGYGLKVSP